MLPKTCQLLAENKAVRTVCYGDSISEVGRSPGWYGGATTAEGNWGHQFGRRMAAAHPRSRIDVVHFGVGGHNSYEGLGRLDWLGLLNPHLVLVEFGANDCGWHYLLPEETYLAQKTLAEWIRARHGADVVLVGCGGDNPARPSFCHLDETLAATRRAAQETGNLYVDLRTAVVAATQGGRLWTDFHNGEQDCHPNDAGHRLWGDTVFAAVEAVLAATP